MQASRHRVGVLIARVWREGSQVRARITQTVDAEADEPQHTVEQLAASKEAILESVATWLDELLPSA